MERAATVFFTAKSFAVAGASQATDKFGYKLLAWYHGQELRVTPINPSRSTIEVEGTVYSTISSPTKLPFPSQTSLSIVTPPAITKQILYEAKACGVSAVWLQPGSFDADTLGYAKTEFATVVGGFGGKTKGHEGWCILVDGPDALRAAARL